MIFGCSLVSLFGFAYCLKKHKQIFSLAYIQALCGIAFLIGLALLASIHHQAISWNKIGRLALSQAVIMGVFLKFPGAQSFFLSLTKGVEALRHSVLQGTQFVFGYLGSTDVPFASTGSTFIFFFQALPMILLMGSLSLLLFHWGVLPWIVRALSRVGARLWGLGGALSSAMAAKVFFGQTDTPLFIKPYLIELTRNELFSLMTMGMATASCVIVTLYVGFLENSLGAGQAMTHVLISGLVNIPSALIVAEIFFPENEPLTHGVLAQPYRFSNAMQAIAKGAQDGWHTMGAIGAILVVSLALVSLTNQVFGEITLFVLGKSWSLEQVLAYVFLPFSWAMGLTKSQLLPAGELLAQKSIFNEVVALASLNKPAYSMLDARAISILSYSLCNFGNLSSLGIQVATLSQLVPERAPQASFLAGRALLASLIAGALSSSLVSLFL